jgi:hypothetical protein
VGSAETVATRAARRARRSIIGYVWSPKDRLNSEDRWAGSDASELHLGRGASPGLYHAFVRVLHHDAAHSRLTALDREVTTRRKSKSEFDVLGRLTGRWAPSSYRGTGHEGARDGVRARGE